MLSRKGGRGKKGNGGKETSWHIGGRRGQSSGEDNHSHCWKGSVYVLHPSEKKKATSAGDRRNRMPCRRMGVVGCAAADFCSYQAPSMSLQWL